MDRRELKKLRKLFGYSQTSFGEKVGLSERSVVRYEGGEREITERVEKQIFEALGVSYENKADYQLHVHWDYLRLTFFGTTKELVMRNVLGVDPKRFIYEENKRHGYDCIYHFGSIKLYVSEKLSQGFLLELSGQGISELEELFAERGLLLNDWLLVILSEDYYLKEGYYRRVQCSRVDIAIDEMYQEGENYDLHELKEKIDRKIRKEIDLVETSLRNSQNIESCFQGESQGLTLYFGSKSGCFLVRMYEKAKERMSKEQINYEEALTQYGVVNRYELQLSEQYAEYVLNELIYGTPLNEIAVNLLLSKISVYEEVKNERGELEICYCSKFYNVFGKHKKVKVNGKENKRSIEQSMEWVERQVVGTLAMIKEVFGKKWLYDWLERCMAKVEFTEKQEKMILSEMVRVDNGENALFTYIEVNKTENDENVI